jgi:hypothetical protein
MKILTTTPHSSRRRTLWLAGGFLLVGIIAASVLSQFPSASAHSNGPAPVIALLTLQDGASLNSQTLRVQALVAAVRSRIGESFVFNGQTVAGRNAGRVRRVDLVLDGILLQSINTSDYGRQFVTDFKVNLSAVNEGLHVLTISALQGNGNNETTKSVSTTFTLDRSLVLAERNRIEDAATPKPFAGLRVRGWDGQDDDDADEEDPWQCPPRFDLKGTITLGSLSDGIDLAADRVVVALGSQTKVFEAGRLNCNRQEKICRFEDGSAPFVRFIELKRKNDGRWKYRLRGVGPLPGSGGPTLSLRIGNDWGGVNLATGERLAGLRLNLDTSHQAQALIGAAGGTIEGIDARSVVMRLVVPAGALTQDTLIKMTPLESSPLAGGATGIHPGVKFEPEGLQFAEAATLTMDFSATNQSVGNQDAVFLLTSPMTALPLFGRTDPGDKVLTARLHHFSVARPGGRNNSQTDLSWANALLLGNQNFTLSELELLVSLITNSQQAAQFTQLATNSIAALASALCPSSITSPTDQALERLLQLENIGQGLGVDTNALGVRGCAEQVFRALIEQHGLQASINPSDGNLARLLNDASKAQLLGFDNLDTLALQRLAAALRALLAQAQAEACSGHANAREVATNMLNRARNYAAAVQTVDASLDGDIQTALADVQTGRACGAMRVTINPADTDSYNEGATQIIVRHNCVYRLVTPGGSQDIDQTLPNGQCTGDLIPGFGGGPSSTPFSLEGQIDGAQANLVITQPSPNVLVMDASASAVSTGLFSNNLSSGNVIMDLTFTKPGVLSFALNPGWRGTAITPVGGVFSIRSERPDAFLQGYMFFNNVLPDTLTGQRVIAAPGTIRLNLQFNVQQGDLGSISGSGRAVTITFTPTP